MYYVENELDNYKFNMFGFMLQNDVFFKKIFFYIMSIFKKTIFMYIQVIYICKCCVKNGLLI